MEVNHNAKVVNVHRSRKVSSLLILIIVQKILSVMSRSCTSSGLLLFFPSYDPPFKHNGEG